MKIRVAINGAAGRMGRRLIACCQDDSELSLVAALESSDCPHLGQDSGTVAGVGPNAVTLSDQLSEACDVLIDFSNPQGAEAALQLCLDYKIPLVLATTGLEPDFLERVHEAAHHLPVLTAANTSSTVNLAIHLAGIAARTLKSAALEADVEIIERHHRMKQDAPSGTALRFGQVIADQMKLTEFTHGRQGLVGPRPQNQIGYHAVRTGDDPGQHLIVFGLMGETLEIRVAASNRDCYARGALAAAKFLCACGPGIYAMSDVLNFPAELPTTKS